MGWLTMPGLDHLQGGTQTRTGPAWELDLLVRRILECSVSLATHIPQLLREMVDARQVSAATNSLKSLQGFPFYNKPMRQQAQSKRL